VTFTAGAKAANVTAMGSNAGATTSKDVSGANALRPAVWTSTSAAAPISVGTSTSAASPTSVGTPTSAAAPTPDSTGQASHFDSRYGCKYGYHQRDQMCVPVDVPAHAYLNSFGDDWKCDRGFRRVNGRCDPIVVPDNA